MRTPDMRRLKVKGHNHPMLVIYHMYLYADLKFGRSYPGKFQTWTKESALHKVNFFLYCSMDLASCVSVINLMISRISNPSWC